MKSDATDTPTPEATVSTASAPGSSGVSAGNAQTPAASAAVPSAAAPSSPAVRSGRRPGPHAGREQILQAATAQFGEHGYQSTTIRKIAQAAGVDAKLVHYYFGLKEELFTTAITEAFRDQGFPALFIDHPPGSEGSVGVRYLSAVLTMLEDPGIGPAFIGLVRGLGTHEESRRIFLRFVGEELIGRLAPHLAPHLGRELAETRVALAGSQMLGLVFARYVLKIPPLATLSIEEVAHSVGPTIERYILGPLEWGGPADAAG